MKKRDAKKEFIDCDYCAGAVDGLNVLADEIEKRFDGARIWQTHHVVELLRDFAASKQCKKKKSAK